MTSLFAELFAHYPPGFKGLPKETLSKLSALKRVPARPSLEETSEVKRVFIVIKLERFKVCSNLSLKISEKVCQCVRVREEDVCAKLRRRSR